MTTTSEYALLAGASYYDTRDAANRFPIPEDWRLVERVPEDTQTGFEASAYRNTATNEIAISYAGTDQRSAADIMASFRLGLGYESTQLIQAADYYLSIKNDPRYAGCNITLTGHSLGGGLAALVGVFFGVRAYAFDQAPFANAAQEDSLLSNPLNILTPDVAADLKNTLLASGYGESNLVGLSNFLQLREASGGIPNSELISGYRVDGEFLTSLPYDAIGAETLLTHGDYFGPLDLHTQAILTTFVQSNAFREMTNRLPELLGMVFDENLFAVGDLRDSAPNLLEHLIRHQVGLRNPETGAVTMAADAMLDRFTSDLDKVVQARSGTGGYRDLIKALVAFAMEKYYMETTASPGYQQELFQAVTGGLKFDTRNIAANITGAKGYQQYFTQYLETDPLFTFEEQRLIRHGIADLHDWSIAMGSDGMAATDTGNQGAFMLGGDGSDALTGGSADDLLVGGAGSDELEGGGGDDILLGGKGSDTLNGGSGYDRYVIEGSDTVEDSDGKGILTDRSGRHISGMIQKRAGGTYVSQSDSIVSASGDADLTLTLVDGSSVTIEGYQDGYLNIRLFEEEALSTQFDRTIVGDFSPKDFDPNTAGVQTQTDDLGNVVLDEAQPEPGRKDGFHDSEGNDLIKGLGGDDFIYSWRGGDDQIEGGDGNDLMIGGMGKDIVIGGAGRDVLVEGGGDDKLYADNVVTLEAAIAAQNAAPSGTQGEALSGGDGDDLAIGGTGNDVLFGGTGDDILVAGAGNDDIDGDAVAYNIMADWSTQRNVTSTATGTSYNILYNQFTMDWPTEGGDDYLDGEEAAIARLTGSRRRPASADFWAANDERWKMVV